MRQLKAQQLLSLAIAMQGSPNGMSLHEICELMRERFGEKVSRRTAERMRDSLVRMFPQIRFTDCEDGLRRWILPRSLINNMVSFSAEELACFKNVIEKVESKNLSADIPLLKELCDKIEALLPKKDHIRLLPDIQALTESEGIACRPGPSDNISRIVVLKIRTAILGMKKIRIHYHWRNIGEIHEYEIEPYGFLFGSKGYLVAYSEENSDYRNYILNRIDKVEIIDEFFERDEDFSFNDYTKHMFGSFREEPFEAKLEFSRDVQKEVMDYIFHPTQVKTVQDDGKILVELYVGGVVEICWHIFQWGKDVKILKPAKLRDKYCKMISEISQLY